MAVTSFASGTQTCTVTTEHTYDVNEAGTFVFEIDTNALAANDVLELRAYKMVLTSGTTRVAYFQAYYGVQPTDDKIKISLPISNDITDATSIRFSMKQTFGTGRAIPYKILKHA